MGLAWPPVAVASSDAALVMLVNAVETPSFASAVPVWALKAQAKMSYYSPLAYL